MTRFDADTAVARAGEGAYTARLDPGWWVVAGPNGGYLAAVALRALTDTVADPERAPRSLTVHYTAPPQAGEVRIEAATERTGRSLTNVSGRLVQGGRLVALALAAFSKARPDGLAHERARMPEVPPPERCPPLEPGIPIHGRYEQRWAVGREPFSGADTALCGGWIRLAEPRPLDACVAAAYADAFPPAILSTLAAPGTSRGVPTIDLTIHFRETLTGPETDPQAFTLAVFRTRLAREGFLEEDGELWSRDGRLLAQSRQLALAR